MSFTQVQVPDFAGTILRGQQGQLSQLQALAMRQDMADRQAASAVMQAAGPGLMSTDAAKRQSVLAELAGAGAAGMQMAMPFYQQEQQRMRRLTPQEAAAAGYRPGTVVSENMLGQAQVAQQPDTWSAERRAQEEAMARLQAGLSGGNAMATARLQAQTQMDIARMQAEARPPQVVFDPASPSGFRYVAPGSAATQPAPAPEGYRQPVMPFGPGTQGASLAFIESLAPAIREGTATPEQVARYLSAVTEYQQERVSADGTRIVPRLPPYAPGADEVVRRYQASPAQVAPAVPQAVPPPQPQVPQPTPPQAPQQQGGVQIPGTRLQAEPPQLQPAPLPGAAGGVARAPQAAPNTVMDGMLSNVDGLRRAREALDLATRNPGAFGMWQGAANMVPGALERLDPSGVQARAAAADLGSLRVHDRSGAAVTAAEFPRLRPFVPQVGDPPEVVRTKLQRFVAEYENLLRDQYETYGPRGGFRQQPVVEDALRGGGTAGPPADPLGILRGNR